VRRREVIGGLSAGLTAWPLRAQQRRPVIGFLSSESPALFASRLMSFREGLRETGFVEGENVEIEFRWAEGQNDRLPELAADLVRHQVNVIAVPGTTPGALAAKRATSTIPVVINTAGDPVALGLVASLSRPGGNVTGRTSIGGELGPKRLELLREAMPAATVMALLVNPSNPALMETTAQAVRAAAVTLGLELHVINVGTEAELDAVFPALVQLRASGLVIAIDSFFTARREKLASLAIRHGIAAIYQYRDFAAAGGLMSYGDSLADGYRLVGVYTGRILKDGNPADLPIHRPSNTELVVSIKNATTLSLTIPRNLLARADEVIE
jgi:putative tryptophan/tyrosine transport system substrate-binding protein